MTIVLSSKELYETSFVLIILFCLLIKFFNKKEKQSVTQPSVVLKRTLTYSEQIHKINYIDYLVKTEVT